jgi:phosphatidate phosphatase APP1
VAGDPRRDPLQHRLLAAFRARPALILPYLGYGGAGKATLCGRVLKSQRLRPALEGDRRWRNLVAFLKLMESDEVPGARVRATFQGRRYETVTDREGYFHFEFALRKGSAGWQEAVLEPHAIARVLIPSPRARFGVISDIDDTLVPSGAAKKIRMIIRLAVSNALTRKPFEGVAAFYRALHAGVNPVFYVSKSPWNLYLPLLELLRVQRIPLGPLLLRDYGLHLLRRGKQEHKLVQIDRILTTCRTLPFVLVGDSGERDPEVYSEIVRRFPGRIRVIYIRAVDLDARRLAAIEQLAAQVRKTKCQLVLAPDTAFAAAHALGEGLIRKLAAPSA